MNYQAGEQAKPERHYDIDWLRVLATLAVFLFHCARLFNYEDWHVKNNEQNLIMSVFVSFLVLWIMPILFFISGEGSFLGLTIRSGGRYIGERIKRLVIPFVGGTVVIIIPLQVYYERVQHSEFVGSFLDFYPHYFDGLYALGGNFAWMGLHLWFLGYLFIISALSLPLFLLIKKKAFKVKSFEFATIIKKPGAILLFAIPLIIIELIVNLQPTGIGSRVFGGWSLAQYLFFFTFGYLFASDIALGELLVSNRKISLVAGLVASIFYISVSYYIMFKGHDFIPRYLEYFFRGVFRPSCSWFLLVAILGYGRKYLNFNNRILKNANEAVLPFYILHQTVIVTLGFHLAAWNAGVTVKYLIVSTSAFIIIVSLYAVIRRFGWLRFLFGMKG